MTKDQQNALVETVLRSALVAAIKRHPAYVSADDDLGTPEGLIRAATYILDRIADDNDKFRRSVGALNRANAFRNGD